jgi:hypothetical protein
MDWVPKADDDWCFMYIYIYNVIYI